MMSEHPPEPAPTARIRPVVWWAAGGLVLAAAAAVLWIAVVGRAPAPKPPPYRANQAAACKLLATVTKGAVYRNEFLSAATVLIEKGTGGQAAVMLGGPRRRQFTARFAADALAVFETGLNLSPAPAVARLQRDCAAVGVTAPVWPAQLTAGGG
jgi:hypothetical protein